MAKKKQMTLVLTVAALLGALGGCGGSGDSSSPSNSNTAADTTAESSSSTDSSSSSSAGAIAEFGKNQITTYGEEASDDEREAASRVLEENLQARASGDWAGQCATVTAATAAQVEEEVQKLQGTKSSCAKGLESQSLAVPKSTSVRVNTMTEPIAALRIEANQAFALYHGAKGVDYAMPLIKEGGEWKVASLVEEEVR